MRAFSMSRRSFLGASAAALAAPAVLRGTPAVAAPRPTTPSILNNGTFPIGVFFPPPLNETTDARYKQLADCGITFVEGGTGGNDVYNLEPNKVLLPVCERHNVLAIVNDERQNLFNQPQDQWRAVTEQILKDYRPYPMFSGFHGGDELPETHYPALAGENSLLHELAPTKLNQVNLLGAPHGTPTYMDYVQTYITQTNPAFLSFDRYMLLDPAQTTPEQQQQDEAYYFSGWADVRTAALGAGNLPTWMYVQNVAHLVYRAPNVAELLWQVNTAMAYGCTGIQYFTYWTPPPYGSAMIDKSGNPTPNYYNAQLVNTEFLQPVGRQLLGLVSESVAHSGEPNLPPGVVAFTGNDWISAASGDAVIISVFRNPRRRDERLLLVANRSYADTATATLTATSAVRTLEQYDTSARRYRTLRTQDGRFPVRLDPGAATLIRLHVRS